VFSRALVRPVPVRKSESRIPAGLQASDLGQAVVASDGRCALVASVSSPIVVNRDNVYVAFVTDSALAAATESFEWSFALDGGTPAVQTTSQGATTFRPSASGALSLTLRLLGAGNDEKARLTLTQDVVATNAALEELIDAARNEQGPTVVNPDVARELVNEHNLYYQGLTATPPESDDAFARFLFTLIHDGALERTPATRRQQLERLASALNDGSGDWAPLLGEGVGVCGLRLPLVAMTTTPSGGGAAVLPWTELPESGATHTTAEADLRQAAAALDADTRTDLFNRVRFPKSNIAQCARILLALRDRYFPGVGFEGVLTGLSGTRASWILRHFRDGPLHRD